MTVLWIFLPKTQGKCFLICKCFFWSRTELSLTVQLNKTRLFFSCCLTIHLLKKKKYLVMKPKCGKTVGLGGGTLTFTMQVWTKDQDILLNHFYLPWKGLEKLWFPHLSWLYFSDLFTKSHMQQSSCILIPSCPLIWKSTTETIN